MNSFSEKNWLIRLSPYSLRVFFVSPHGKQEQYCHSDPRKWDVSKRIANHLRWRSKRYNVATHTNFLICLPHLTAEETGDECFSKWNAAWNRKFQVVPVFRGMDIYERLPRFFEINNPEITVSFGLELKDEKFCSKWNIPGTYRLLTCQVLPQVGRDQKEREKADTIPLYWRQMSSVFTV